MHDFTYYNPVKVVFGTTALEGLAELLPKSGVIMMTMGKGSIKKNGVYDKVKAALGGTKVIEFAGIEPNPEYDICMEAASKAKAEGVTFFLSVGGGSVLDATKFIAAAMEFNGADPWDILEKQTPVSQALPIGCVLTLPATGSEVNGNAVISRYAKGQKLSFSSPLVMPKFSILDPTTTLTLSERQTANGIVDAFVHVMEQYLTYDVDTPLQDRQAEAILKTLVDVAPKIKEVPSDLGARSTIMWCASNALNGLIKCGAVEDWATHMIGHEITAIHNLDHARTLAIVLPAMMKHQRKQKSQKIVQYGRRVWHLTGLPNNEAIDKTIQMTEAFFETVGCPTTLSAYDISVESCLPAAERLAERGNKLGERQDIGKEEVEAILRLSA
jgi:NADP-dependent alcohol dehydrogenase